MHVNKKKCILPCMTKDIKITVRITEEQKKALDQLMEESLFEKQSAIIRYLIDNYLDQVPRKGQKHDPKGLCSACRNDLARREDLE